jgi:hypothetical protein
MKSLEESEDGRRLGQKIYRILHPTKSFQAAIFIIVAIFTKGKSNSFQNLKL